MVSLRVFREHPIAAALSGLAPVRVWERRPRLIYSVCIILLVSSLLFGGGTRAGFLSDALLQLLAVPALLIALTSLIDLPIWRTTIKTNTYWALAFCFAIALVPLLQLIPLPPLIWTKLPGREAIVNVLSLVGDHLPWRPISV